MSLFFRVFSHLLPRSKAWNLTIDRTLRKFFEGLASPFGDARDYADEVYRDLDPDTTREIAAWEEQFGLQPAASVSEANRRLALAAEWASTGGQSPSYIQGVVQAAGFTNVFIHEWWSSASPYVARDPRTYTNVPIVGTYQCDAIIATQPECNEQSFADQPQCNNFLANDPKYLVNKTLRQDAPPPVPDDPAFWPYFLYFGGSTFGTFAQVDNDRREEFERRLLKLCPTQNWIVIGLIDFVTVGVFDGSFSVEFE